MGGSGENYFSGNFRSLVEDLKTNKLKKNKKSIRASGRGYHYLSGIVRDFISEPDHYLISKGNNLIRVLNACLKEG